MLYFFHQWQFQSKFLDTKNIVYLYLGLNLKTLYLFLTANDLCILEPNLLCWIIQSIISSFIRWHVSSSLISFYQSARSKFFYCIVTGDIDNTCCDRRIFFTNRFGTAKNIIIHRRLYYCTFTGSAAGYLLFWNKSW